MKRSSDQDLEPDQKTNRAVSRVHYFISLGSVGKAFNAVRDYEADVSYTPLTEEEKKEQAEILFPSDTHKAFVGDLRGITMQEELKKPDREQILSIINEYALVTSPGPSGIAIGHIQYLTKLKGFYDTLMKVYYSLLEKPELNIGKLPNLFRFDTHFIPKPKKSEDSVQQYRPICCSELLLNVFEKSILSELASKIKLEDEQFVNKPNGGLRAKYKLLEFQRSRTRKDIIKLDLKNAFNSLSVSEIERALTEYGIAPVNLKLIINSIRARHSVHVPAWRCGTPQGSPMSSLAFCAGINVVLKRLKQKYGVVAYVDDCLLICELGHAQEAIHDAKLEFGKIGLTLKDDKCEILSRDESIEFLSQKFINQAPDAVPESFSIDLKKKMEKLQAQLLSLPLPSHETYLLYRQVVVNCINWGPLLDASDESAGYHVLDKMLAALLK